jgi:exoribonuclease-2
MAPTFSKQNSLVLYKTRPALVKQVGTKIDIEVENGKHIKVRPKDITLLHPGPVQDLTELKPQVGEVETAWELLSGQSTPLQEVAELVFGAYTPYFHGTPEAVIAALPEQVAQTRAARDAKAAREQARASFLARIRSGQFEPEDEQFLREVEEVALARRSQSRILRELGRAESPESAHALLLELAYWDDKVDPYPQRLQVVTTVPTASMPDLTAENRVDLTHLPTFAIDDEGSRDPDDALSLDGTRLWVHVADVAALVAPGSPADQEARARGANLYLPEGTVPMLPGQATQILGLGLTETSPALSFGLDLGDQSQVTNLEIVPSWVRVERLTYEQAEARLDRAPFDWLDHLARRNEERRRANGAAVIELPEVKVRLVEGQVVVRPLLPLKSRNIVREAMLMAGEAVARFALENDIPFLFTGQAPPVETGFSDTVSGMFALRRNFSRSQVKTVPGPHAGLGLEVYTQATSPLRRYADLVAHQQLRAFLRDDNLLDTAALIERVGAAAAVTGGIRQAERLANKHWTLVYLLNQPAWRGEGILVDKRNRLGTVLIPELDLDSRVHLPEELPLDASIQLELSQVNLAELEAHFLANR